MFDASCRLIVVNQMLQQNTDYVFDPSLQNVCSKNIAEHCTTVVATAKRDENLTSIVVNCLTTKFNESSLTISCEERMADMLAREPPNHRLNIRLIIACRPDINANCGATNQDERAEMEECLKISLLTDRIVSGKCKFEVALLMQASKGGIFAKVPFHRACALDFLKYCWHINTVDEQSKDSRQLFEICVLFDFHSKFYIVLFSG